MDKEQKAAEQIKAYVELAKANPKMDVTKLALSALSEVDRNTIPVKEKRWAYLASLVLPPVGLFYGFKFFVSDHDDGEHAALMCLVLSLFSIGFMVTLFKGMFAGSGVDVNQIKNINPQDIYELTQ